MSSDSLYLISQWYNNAPILELLLSEVRLQGQADVRVSSMLVTADVVANYHNIEKVTTSAMKCAMSHARI